MSGTRRNFFSPPDGMRCQAHAPTTVKGEGARCMRRRMIGGLCTQHYKLQEMARKSSGVDK